MAKFLKFYLSPLKKINELHVYIIFIKKLFSKPKNNLLKRMALFYIF